MKNHEAYQALPRKVSQQVLRLLHKNWMSFFKAIKAWKADPSQFLGRPCLPKYKDKQHGRNILVYTVQAISKPALAHGMIVPSGLPILIETRQQTVDQVRIVPRAGYYVVEVIYEQPEQQADVNGSYNILRKVIPNSFGQGIEGVVVRPVEFSTH